MVCLLMIRQVTHCNKYNMNKYSIQSLSLGSKQPISKLLVWPNNSLIVVVQDYSTGGSILSILEEPTQNEIFSKPLDQILITSVAIKDDILAFAKNDNSIDFLDLVTLGVVSTLNVNGKISTIRLYGDLVLLSGKRLEIWDWKQNKLMWSLNDYFSGTITEKWSYESLNCSWYYSEYLKQQPFINLPALGVLDSQKDQVLICGNNSAKLVHMSWKNDNRIVKEIHNAPLQVSNLTTSRTGKYLLTSGKIPDGEFLWNLELNKRHLENLFNEHFRSSKISAFHPDEKSLARGFLNGHVLINSLNDGGVLFMEKLHNGEVTGLCYDNIGDTMYTSGLDGEAYKIKFDS